MMKTKKRILSLFLAFVMVFATVFIAQAEGFQVREGGFLVSDQDTRYITIFDQDLDTRMITATVQIQNNNATEQLVISGVATSIAFTSDVIPYNIVKGTLYQGGTIFTNDVKEYGMALTETLTSLSPRILSNNENARIIGAKIGAPSTDAYLYIAPNTTVDIYKYYFMPKDGAELSIDTFDYSSKYEEKSRLISTWIGNGYSFMAANRDGLETNNVKGLEIYSDAFKIQIKKETPVNLTSDNDVREIVGYDPETMEWSDTIDGTYQSEDLVVGDDARTIYIRTKGDSDYSLTSPDNVYVNYKKHISSEAVEIEFEDAFFPANTYAEKISEGSREDGTTHVGDTLTYTITTGNNADARSTWSDVVVTDALPQGVTFVNDSVKVDGEDHEYSYDETSKTLTVSLGDIIGGTEKVVVFEVTVDDNAYGETIKNTATVTGKDGEDGEDITLNPTEPGDGKEIVEKSEDPTVDKITEGDKEITGTGEVGSEIIVKLPDGTEVTTEVEEDGTWTVEVPDGVELVDGDKIEVIQVEEGKDPSDKVEVIIDGRPDVVPELSKTSENISRVDGTTHVNDTLKYTISVKNDGDAKSLWTDVIVSDDLPEGLDFVENSVKVNGEDATYEFTDGTLVVQLGNIAGGAEKLVTFEATVQADAHGKNIENTAVVSGKDGDKDIEKEVTEPDGGTDIIEKSEDPTVDNITEGDKEITGTGEVGSEIIVTFPGEDGDEEVKTIVKPDGTWTVEVPDGVELVDGDKIEVIQVEDGKNPSDKVEVIVDGRPNIGDGNAVVTKTSENLTREDGATRVGDTLEYTIVAQNNGDAKSLWVDVVVKDTLPTEVTFKPGSVKLNGETVAYEFVDGTLTVALGDILGATQKTITFEAIVNENAYGQTFANSAEVKGKDGGDGSEVDVDTTEEGGQSVSDKSAKPEVDEINDGDRTVTGTGVPGATITISYETSTLTSTVTVDENGDWTAKVPGGVNLVEGTIVKAVQTEEDFDPSDTVDTIVQAKKDVIPFMEKTSENISSDDDYTRVGDKVRYTITVRNDGSPKSIWTSTTVSDALPEGVTYVANSVRLNGTVPTYSSYDTGKRMLNVTVGDIAGGIEKVITFEVTIDEDAYGLDIKNSASITGKNNGGEVIGTETTEEGGQDVLDKSVDPIVDDVTRGDNTVTGTGVPGATIEVTFPGGIVVITTVDEEDGTWSVDIPEDLDLQNNDTIYVVQTEKNKDKSNEVPAIVNDKSYRAVTGSVWPVFGKDLNLGIDVIVELRTTFRTAAPDELSTKADIGLNGDGTFTIENVPFGEYVLYIKRPGYLARAMMVTISESDPDIIVLTSTGETENGVFILVPGDTNDSGLVDTTDLMAVNSGQDSAFAEDGYNIYLDFNASGLIDSSDLMTINAELDKSVYDYAGVEGVDFRK